MNIDNSTRDKARKAAASTKKPYKAPSFRFEPVFEVAALACGKVYHTQGGCRFSRKAS